MLRSWCARAAWVAAACCLSTGFVEPAIPCAPAPPANKKVEIADESAIIVWDADTKTEHFIRRASFKSDAADFGFLVPTPNKPELAEADDAAFETLAKFTAPEIIDRPRPSLSESGGGGCGCAADKKAGLKSEAAKAEVRVLEEKRVAGFDAAVLEADTAEVLADWLNKNGYHFSPALTEWAGHYIKLKWKITAFKIAKKSADEAGVATSSVRMSFRADAPFYPYREPAADPKAVSGRRFLRVFLLADKRMRGALGDDTAKWPGNTAWAGKIGGTESLFAQLKLPAPPAGRDLWLTEFEDASSPRPGHADVTFGPSFQQDTVKREPHIRYVSTPQTLETLAWYAPFACLLLALGLSRRGSVIR